MISDYFALEYKLIGDTSICKMLIGDNKLFNIFNTSVAKYVIVIPFCKL